MKVRGRLQITKNLILPNPGGSTASAGLVAISDADGSLSWKHFYVLDVDESLTYGKGTFVMNGEDVYFARQDNAPGALPLDNAFWTELGSGSGTVLTQDQINAINNASSPNASNPFATTNEVNNLSIKGTDTLVNILAKSAILPNNVWITSEDGVDGLGNPVIVGDGLTSNGSVWIGIGPMRGPQGEVGPKGTGTQLVGSDTVSNILLKDAAAGIDTMWLSIDGGLDDDNNLVNAGDGLVSDGTKWTTIGQMRGPKGDQGETGAPGDVTYSGTYLIKGGVEWLYGYTYRVTADKYVIAGYLYSAAPDTITLVPADALQDRTDIIVVNTQGVIYAITGDGVKTPVANDAIELRLTYIDVIANTTVDPAISSTIVYDEGNPAEFTASVVYTGGASIDLDYVGQASSGTISTRVLNGRNAQIQYLASGPITIGSNFSVLSFKMKSLYSSSHATVTIWLFNGNEKVGKALPVSDFGYTYTDISDWQTVTMYVNYFDIFASSFDRIILDISDPTGDKKSDFLIDNIRYQFGIYVRPESQFIEYTSQLINNGDGVSNFATLLDLAALSVPPLDSVTSEGNTSSSDIIVATDEDNTVIIKNDGSMVFQNGPTSMLTLDGDHTSDIFIKLPTESGKIALQKTFVHTQVSVAGVWNVTHNLNKYPSITVTDSSRTTVDALVTYVDENNITVSVTPAISGYVYIN